MFDRPGGCARTCTGHTLLVMTVQLRFPRIDVEERVAALDDLDLRRMPPRRLAELAEELDDRAYHVAATHRPPDRNAALEPVLAQRARVDVELLAREPA